MHKLSFLCLFVCLCFFGFHAFAADEKSPEKAKPKPFTLSSSAILDGAAIPARYACGQNDQDFLKPNPPLQWYNPPKETKSFVLLVDDTHPVAKDWVHWLVKDIPAVARRLDESASQKNLPKNVVILENSFKTKAYGGPCPPPGSGKHIYRFMLFAMPTETTALEIKGQRGKELEKILTEKALAVAQFTGKYER